MGIGTEKRDANGVASKCALNARTKESVVLEELNDMIKQGDKIDAALVAVENKKKTGESLSADEAQDVKDRAAEMFKLLKATARHMSSLNATLKL